MSSKNNDEELLQELPNQKGKISPNIQSAQGQQDTLLINNELKQKIEEKINNSQPVSTSAEEEKIAQASNRDELRIENNLKEKTGQRRIVLWTVIITLIWSIAIITIVIGLQGYKRWKYPDLYGDFVILDNFQLELFIVSVFINILGVVTLVSNKLWDKDEQKLLFDQIKRGPN